MTSADKSGVTTRRIGLSFKSLAPLLLLATVMWSAFAGGAQAQADPLVCFGQAATIVGTDNSEVLNGTSGPDVIVGLGGNDLINGRGGDDRICAGSGNDSVNGGDGNDLIDAGPGGDLVQGGNGNDRMFGRDGNDSMMGGSGDDELFGGDGSDDMQGGPGTDNCDIETSGDSSSGCEADLPPNVAPSDILLDDQSVPENEPGGTQVGVLSAVDPDVEDIHTFSLVAGPGDGDNAAFTISGNSLNTTTVFDFETDSTYSVRIQVSDGTAVFQKQFEITVTDANDPPVAVDDSATVNEDSSANPIDVLANDTDLDGGPKTISAASDPANGSVALTGGSPGEHSGLTYTPDADYCNNPPGSSLDTFTYTLNGGSTAAVSVTVDCVDDAPVAGDDSATVAEDSSANPIDVLSNDTDIDGGPKTISSASDPANGTVAPTGGSPGAHTGLSYTPDADYCNDPPGSSLDTFTYTLNGGSTATVFVTVDCVDDPPVAVDDSATVAEDSSANPIDVLSNDTDIDGGPKTISAASDPANGSVALTGGTAGAHTGLAYTPDADYCNTPPGSSLDTFTYTLNGGPSATVSVSVTCVDDPPEAVDDAATVNEDSSANPIDVLSNDTDIDGGPKTISSASDPANGSVSLTGGSPGEHTGLTYTPDGNYCNDPPGSSPDTFTYTLNGGSIATVLVTVTCEDDPPGALDDSATVAEDSSATSIDVLDDDTDPEGDAVTIASASDPANGTVVLTGGSPGAHTGLTYQPDADYCNTPPGTTLDTFTYTLGGGSTATVSVTVNCIDDAPVAVDDAATVAEDSAASPIDVLANDTDLDGGPKTISSASDPSNGTVALTGGSPGEHTGLTYTPDADYCNDPPGTDPDTFTYTINGGSAATVSITVTCVDDGPLAVDDSATVNEDAPATSIDVLTNDTDLDGGPKTISSASDPANGTVALTGGTPGEHTGLAYTPDANYCNDPPGDSPDTFTYTLNGGSAATVSVTVTCQDEPPVVETSAGNAGYTEGDPATAIDPAIVVSHPDGAMITGATVEITANYAGAEDNLALTAVHPLITPSVTGNTLTLTGSATAADYQAALRDVTYSNPSDGPSTQPRTVTFTVTDSNALSSGDTRTLEVTAVNDPPTAIDDTGTNDEDTALNVPAPGVLANDTDVDPGDTKTVVALNGSGTLTGTSAEGGSVAINANGSYTYTPPAAFQALSTGESDTDSFQYTMADGAGAQSTATVNLTVEGVSDAPTAGTDTFDAVGNTGLFVGATRPPGDAGKEITGSVLANDTDPDTPHAGLNVEPVTNAPTALGGSITIEGDGNFTYHPDDGDVGATDTFTYRVCDSSPCNSATVANSTGTINLVLTGQVWYVRNNQAAGGDGTSDTPFDTLAEAEAASGTGDTVFIFDGDNTTTNLDTGYVMQSQERLVGESRPLSLDPDGGGPLPSVSLHPGTSGAQPTLTASNEDVVVLAGNVLVDGVDVDPSGTGGGISGGSGTGDVTVSNVNVVDTGTAGTQPGIEMDATTGVNRFTGVTVTNGGTSTAIGVRLNNAGSVLFANTATNTIATSGAKALDAAGTNLLTSRWNDITVTGSGTGAVRLNGVSGTPSLGDGAGTDLALQTTSGATAALDIASSSSVSVDSAGSDTISATGGPAADIRNTNGSQFHFDSVSSSDSTTDGINLDTNLATPFSAAAGTISGAAGIALDVNAGGAGGDVAYAGTVADGTGQSVEVTNRTGGTVTISGNIGDSGDAGGGIVVSNNTAGSTTFSGASKVLNTGAGHAVALSGNGSATGGHLVSFTNGGLDIDTTSGNGFSAGNGTLTVGGTGNSIRTTTGTGLNVDTAGITAGNLNFESISSNGAPNGIRLYSTGTAGRLLVTGTGGSCTIASTGGCTGGEIRNTTGGDDGGATPTGTAVVLNNTLNPSLTRMWIHDNSNYGVRGTNVSGFTMVDSVVNGANGTSALTAHKDGSVRFEELTGTVTMTNVALSGGHFTNLMVDNTSGTLNATLNNVDSLALNATGGDDAVQFEGIGTSDMNVTYTNSQITTATGDLFQYIGDGTGGGDLDFTNNTLSNNEPSIATGGGGVALVAGARGPATMDVLNNTMRDSKTNALTIIKSRDNAAGTNNLVANISENDIGVAAVVNSGSLEGDGMEITTFGDGNATFNVTNNDIRQYNSSGIQFVAGSGVVDSGQFNLNVSGNAIGNPGNNGAITLLQGIRVDSGVSAGDSFASCVDFGANSITGSSDAANKDFRLVVSQSTTLRQPGYGGGATDGAAFAAFAAGKIGGGAQGTAVANAPGTFSGTGTACP